MGQMINAKCECGFETDVMCLGGGMLNFMTECAFPFYCEECSFLFEGNIFDKSILCPKCHKADIYPYDSKKAYATLGKKNVFNWRVVDEIGRVLVLTDGNYICPSCRKFSLKFFDVGNWD